MNKSIKEFKKFALSMGISSNRLENYAKHHFSNGMVNPMILEEREMNVVALDVFSRLMYERILFLRGPIDYDTADIINAQLLFLNSLGNEDITLFINSPGGSVTDGLAIYDMMNYVTPDVATYCMGRCASMGAVLLSSGQRGKRFSLPHGDIMIHQPSGGVTGQATEIEIMYREMEKCKKTLYQILSENTGKTYEEIAADADRDHWLTPEESLPGVYGKYGMIDEIIKKKQS